MADQATKPVAELIDDLAGKSQLDHECVDPTVEERSTLTSPRD